MRISDWSSDVCSSDLQLWRLPLGDAYDEGLKSPIADMQNIAGPGFDAGSITAAQFQQRFVNKTPWAKPDIAGVSWRKKDKNGRAQSRERVYEYRQTALVPAEVKKENIK